MLFLTNGFICLFYENKFMLISGSHISNRSITKYMSLLLQELVTYCAKDTLATHEVFAALWPQFLSRFPHPVTFAGMLEMGSAYLPIDQTWESYIRDADDTYDDLEKEMRHSLMRLADDACNYLHKERCVRTVFPTNL